MFNFSELQKIRLKPGQILVIGFFAIILIGAILLSLPIATASREPIGFINAFFTATSAVCVTGLAVVDTGTFWSPFGKTVILILIQVGGLGFMTMATMAAFLMGRRITLRGRMVMQEELNQLNISGIVRLTKYILMTTFGIELVGAILLSTRFIPIYGTAKGIAFSVFHSVSAFCNAGFDLIGNGQSLTPFVGDPMINFVIMTLILVGGIGFSVILDVAKNRSYRKFSLHTKVVLYFSAVFLVAGFVLFLILEFNNPATIGNLPFGEKILASAFLTVTPRTAGFNTVDTASLTQASLFLTIILMFIGGSPGSTAGGIKTTTIGIVFLIVMMVIRGKDDVEFANRRISMDTGFRALAVLAIGLSIVICITFLLSITESGFTFMELFFEVISAFGTVGLSLGITSGLSIFAKIVLSFTMFFGRIGPLTIVIALARRKKHTVALIRYPEGKVSVG